MEAVIQMFMSMLMHVCTLRVKEIELEITQKTHTHTHRRTVIASSWSKLVCLLAALNLVFCAAVKEEERGGSGVRL